MSRGQFHKSLYIVGKYPLTTPIKRGALEALRAIGNRIGFLFFSLMLVAALLAGARHKHKDVRQPLSEDLEEHLCRAIDVWHATHRGVTVREILWALESIKHMLTEATKRVGDQPKQGDDR